MKFVLVFILGLTIGYSIRAIIGLRFNYKVSKTIDEIRAIIKGEQLN